MAVFHVRHPSICENSGSIGHLDIARSAGFHAFRMACCTHWVVLPIVTLVLMVLIVPVISKGREMLVVLVGIVVLFICFVGVSFWLGVLIIMVVVVFFGEIMLWASFICLRGTALVSRTASPGSLLIKLRVAYTL